MAARGAHLSGMDHAAADADLVAERYVLGKLPDEERRRFEEHFVDCASCLDRLEAVKGLRGALKELPVDEVSAASRRKESLVSGSHRPWLPRLPVLAAAAGLLVAVGGATLLYFDARRTRRELAGARQASADAQNRMIELQQTIERERAEREPPSSRNAPAPGAAPVVAAVFLLNLTRGGPAAGEPENRVVLGRSSEWLALLFDQPEQGGFSSFRVRLSTTDRRPIGEAMDALPATGRMLAVSLPSSLLAPGDYVLAVEGLTPGGAEAVATYRFRVTHR